MDAAQVFFVSLCLLLGGIHRFAHTYVLHFSFKFSYVRTHQMMTTSWRLNVGPDKENKEKCSGTGLTILYLGPT